MPEFIPGQRYPMSADMANAVIKRGWPVVHGIPDLERGRTFMKAPGDWEFWTLEGYKITCSIGDSIVVSMSKKPDPNRPPPLNEKKPTPTTDDPSVDLLSPLHPMHPANPFNSPIYGHSTPSILPDYSPPAQDFSPPADSGFSSDFSGGVSDF